MRVSAFLVISCMGSIIVYSQDSIKAVIKYKTFVASETSGKVLGYFYPGDKVTIYNFKNSKLYAAGRGMVGHIGTSAVDHTTELNDFIERLKLKERASIETKKIEQQKVKEKSKLYRDSIDRAHTEEREKERIRMIKSVYSDQGKEVIERIINRQYWIDMTQGMAEFSLGPPIRKNKTVGTWGDHEQWVYPNGFYLYFENGRLTSYQE